MESVRNWSKIWIAIQCTNRNCIFVNYNGAHNDRTVYHTLQEPMGVLGEMTVLSREPTSFQILLTWSQKLSSHTNKAGELHTKHYKSHLTINHVN
jgi:hypothetical protein